MSTDKINANVTATDWMKLERKRNVRNPCCVFGQTGHTKCITVKLWSGMGTNEKRKRPSVHSLLGPIHSTFIPEVM